MKLNLTPAFQNTPQHFTIKLEQTEMETLVEILEQWLDTPQGENYLGNYKALAEEIISAY